MNRPTSILVITTVILQLNALSLHAQFFRKGIETNTLAENPKLCESVNGGYYIAFEQDNGIAVSKINTDESVAWVKQITVAASDIKLVTITEDKNNHLLLLYNNVSESPGKFGIVKMNVASGGILQIKQYYGSNAGYNNQATALKVGENGNYFIGANELSKSLDFVKGIFMEIDKTTGNVVKSVGLTANKLAVYDIAQLNTNEWIIGGTYLSGHYKSLIIKYDIKTGIYSDVYMDLAVNHNNIDRIAIDKARQLIFTGSSLWDNFQEDIGYTALDRQLNVQWHFKVVTPANERISTLIFDNQHNKLLTSGKFKVDDGFNFISSIDISAGELEWSKSLKDIDVMDEPKGLEVRLINGQIVYCTALGNAIQYGIEPLAEEPTACMVNVNYSTNKNIQGGGQGVTGVENITINAVDLDFSETTKAYSHYIFCKSSVVLPPSGVPTDTLYYIPGGFTPNEDGLNDSFYIVGNNFSILQMEVFNRWGEKLFEGNDTNGFVWDGTYKSVKVKPDIYVYSIVIRTISGRELSFKGGITVLR